MICHRGHDHSLKKVVVAERNPSEPHGIRPFHCPDCSHANRHNKVTRHWVMRTLPEAKQQRSPCSVCF
jgi:hypothetical protein